MEDRAIYDENILSDLHKDALGYRPSGDYWSYWKALTVAQKNKEWNHLCDTLEEEHKRMLEENERARKEWSAYIQGIADANGVSRETAIRWDMQALLDEGGMSEDEYRWTWNLPFRMELK